MNVIDMRFDECIIKDLIGKTFSEYKCDPFVFTNSVTQIVGLFIADKVYSLTNIQESVDYFGNTEDISVCKFKEAGEKDIQSAFKDTEMISTPVKGIIEKILLVNEKQQLFKDGEEVYRVWLTRGIVFFVNGREISFEKDIVPFSEEIIVRRGYSLLRDFSDEKEFLQSWSEEYEPICNRQVTEIAEE